MRRLTGAAVIVAAFLLAGVSLIRARRERLSALRGLCEALLQLQGELSARLTPLPEIISTLSETDEKNSAAFFQRVADGLGDLGERRFGDIWRASASGFSVLREDEREQLAALGAFLGIYTLSDELCAIGLCRKKLEEHRDEAERELSAYRRSCLGLCGAFGALLALALI